MTNSDADLIALARARGGHVGPTLGEAMDANKIKADVERILGPRQRHVQGRMNKMEARHALELDARKAAGEVLIYWFESVKFRLADKTWYCPDFIVLLATGQYEAHEVKGHWEDDARVKTKVAASMYPQFIFRVFCKGKMSVVSAR